MLSEGAPPTATHDMNGVWTGQELIVWGGGYWSWHSTTIHVSYGAAYDPHTQTWTALPASGLLPRRPDALIWTGHELLIWGGATDQVLEYPDGALFHPL